MGRKCFISFKKEDEAYKKFIQEELDVDMIDKSLDDAIDSQDEDYIMSCLRQDYLADSTVTIHLIGAHSAEVLGKHEQRYIKRELQASLYHGVGNTKNGILGIVLPAMYTSIYGGTISCSLCGGNHNIVEINNRTTIREFNYNYYIPNNGKCHWSEEDRYCVLVKWDDFIRDPETYIERAFAKRTAPIASKTRVRSE